MSHEVYITRIMQNSNIVLQLHCHEFQAKDLKIEMNSFDFSVHSLAGPGDHPIGPPCLLDGGP